MHTANRYLFIVKTTNSTSLSSNKDDEFGTMCINRHAQLVARSKGQNEDPKTKFSAKRHGSASVRSSKRSKHGRETCCDKGCKEIACVKTRVTASLKQCARPIPALDSVCTSVVFLDSDKQRVLDYYTKYWLPSPDSIASGCNITGMTPIRPTDAKIASEVVRGAFQTDDSLSIYAMLAVGSRRMKTLHKMTLSEPGKADLYNIRAIQALRKALESGRKPTHRMVLDLSFLMLSELFSPSPSPYDVYSRVLRDVILVCGGLVALPTFIAQFIIGCDHQTSAGTLARAALDPFTYPELVSITRDSKRSRAEEDQLVLSQLQTMDNRLRLMALQTHSLTLLVDEIQGLSEQAINSMRRYLEKHTAKLYGIICEPLRRSVDYKDTRTGPDVIEADELYIQLRASTWRKWTLSCALSFVPLQEYMRLIPSDSPILLSELPQAWESIARIKMLLEGSGWFMQHDVVLWIAAVRYLTCVDTDEKQRYQEVLRTETVNLCIKNQEQFRTTLQRHFPLDLIHPHFDLELWNAIDH